MQWLKDIKGRLNLKGGTLKGLHDRLKGRKGKYSA